MKLGRLPSIKDSRNLQLLNYLNLKQLPTPPDEVSWQGALPMSGWGMMGNDQLGNCVICTAAHIIDAAQANESKELNPIPDMDVVTLSYQMGATNGYTILERLKWWRLKGIFGINIDAFAEVPAWSPTMLKLAIYCFGHADIGVWMPLAWKDHPRWWDTGQGQTYRPGSWGGHSVCLLGYHNDHTGTIYQAVSWGEVINVTEEALHQYMDEAWVSIVPSWYEKDGVCPSGFNLKQLREDLAGIR